MTTDEKIEAVEDFLAWRENAHPTDPPETLVETWRSALVSAAEAVFLDDIRKEAEFVKDPGEAWLLVERIRSGN